ncbi:hypothetical protein MMC07_009052, partial [Pseudocyphellaria aurata]|nr:hypothetical protein [Pseudocyphellaria aurata]
MAAPSSCSKALPSRGGGYGNQPRRIWAHLGPGAYLGHLERQDGKGHVPGHVKDPGEDATNFDR